MSLARRRMGQVFGVFAIMLVTVGCASAEPATVGTEKGCSMQDDDTGGELLIEQRSDDPQSGTFIRRISPDGTYREFSSFLVSFEDGELVTTQVEPAWRELESLTSGQIDRMRAVIDEHFFELASAYEPPGEISDGFVVTWAACLDDRQAEVELRSVSPDGIEGLADISEVFETVVAEAAEAAGASPPSSED